MKKLLIFVLSLIIALQIGGGALAEAPSDEPTAITVGITTGLSGYFFTEKWGLNTADIDVRELIHGHNTIAWEQNGAYALNTTVVRELAAAQDSVNGDKTYRISLNEGLMYNDGSPITAADYAFSILLLSSPEFAALGGAPTGMDYFAGYEAYQNGEPFSGVRLIDELTIELTLDGRYLPFFYEIVLLNMVPYPIGSIAPFCTVQDDGNGAYIDGPFTTSLLQDMILNEETGYLYKPYVTAGPYRFVSFDPETRTAKFAKNEYYSGNFEGVKPTIDEITVVQADAETALNELREGRLDVVNKVSDATMIQEGMALAGAGEGQMQSYMRTGLSFLSFACEWGPTRSENVRRALAYCIDATAITEEFTQGFGLPVYGYYGLGQWMAMENQEAMAQYEKALDPNEAIYLLQEDGWVLAENGDAYDETEGGVRYRRNDDNQLEALHLNWAQPEETAMSDLLAEQLTLYAESAGFELTITKLPFEELLRHYYRQTERGYHLFSLATNFNLAFDPYATYHTGDEYQNEANKTGLRDEELMSRALAMRQTEVGDNEGYVQKWLAFQERWNALQPMIPLYSNMYFDFYRMDLQEYAANSYVSWATAIVYSYIGEPKEHDLPQENLFAQEPEEAPANTAPETDDEDDTDLIILD